jgi:hypothetical protein
LEYVYFPDKLSGERESEIVDGLKAFLQTGDFTKLPKPDKVNPSGRFKDELKLRTVYGGNSGYVGYSKSKRAVEAEERGLRSVSQMDKDFAAEVSKLVSKELGEETKLSLKDVREAAKKKYVPNGVPEVLHYDNYGEKFAYIISGNAIETLLSPKHQGTSANKGVHLALVEHLDRVIANSIEVEEHPDRLKTGDVRDNENINPDALMHRFYGVARIDGKDYRVMTLMKEENCTDRRNGIHSYEVQKIEVLDEETPNTSNGVGTLNSELEGYPLAKVLKGVVKTMEKDKNLLTESKKADEGLSASRSQSDKNAMADRVTELSESLNTPVRMVRTSEEVEALPSERQRKAKGSYNPRTGEVTVVLPNHADMDDVENTVLHEVVTLGRDIESALNNERILYPESSNAAETIRRNFAQSSSDPNRQIYEQNSVSAANVERNSETAREGADENAERERQSDDEFAKTRGYTTDEWRKNSHQRVTGTGPLTLIHRCDILMGQRTCPCDPSEC